MVPVGITREETASAIEQPMWWQNGVIYQVYLRSFKDTNDDGVGDLAGVVEKLPYLEWLGIDAVWLSPFYPSPMRDFGYDVTDHTDVDPLFGDLAMFDTLVQRAHQRNIKVIIDYVPNHTSEQHPWFRQSSASRDNPRRDWYIWRDPKPGGGPPNNWLSMFGGSAWEHDERTGQYYLHSFLREQPDLNWRNPDVGEAMFDIARFWLERGVDGFRIDVAHFIMKDPEFRDNPPNPEPFTFLGPWGGQLHLNDLAHPDVHGVYRRFRQLLDSYSAGQPRMSIGELYDRDLRKWAGYYGENLEEMHVPFNFHLMRADWKAEAVRETVDAIEATLPEGAWPNWVLGNHDRPRIASRVGPRHAGISMMLLLTLRGTPTLYYGDEIGMTDVMIPSDRSQDPWEKNLPGLGRDPQRTPMQWDGSANAGFCVAGVESWLPVADDYERINVAVQQDDSHSMLSLTRGLLSLRRANPALSVGSYKVVGNMPDDVFAYVRQAGEQRFLIAFNFSDEDRVVDLAGSNGARVLLSTYGDHGKRIGPDGLRLRGDEGCVVELDQRLPPKSG